MKKILLGSLVVAALHTGPALAADWPVAPQPQPVPMAAGVLSWTTWYLGGYVGAAMSEGNTSDPCNVTLGCWLSQFGGETVSYETSTVFTGGLTLGFNYQIPGSGFVFGIESEFGYLHLTSSESFASVSTSARAPNLVASAALDNDLYAATTARFGFAFDRVLLYGKGGFSFGALTSTIVDTAGGYSGNGHEAFVAGLAWGAGVEWAVWPNLSVKAEYLRIDLNKSIDVCGISPAQGGASYCGSTEIEPVETFKIGVNWLINAGPVYIRY